MQKGLGLRVNTGIFAQECRIKWNRKWGMKWKLSYHGVYRAFWDYKAIPPQEVTPQWVQRANVTSEDRVWVLEFGPVGGLQNLAEQMHYSDVDGYLEVGSEVL